MSNCVKEGKLELLSYGLLFLMCEITHLYENAAPGLLSLIKENGSSHWNVCIHSLPIPGIHVNRSLCLFMYSLFFLFLLLFIFER